MRKDVVLVKSIGTVMMIIGMLLVIIGGCGIDAPDSNLKLLAEIIVVGLVISHAGFKLKEY